MAIENANAIQGIRIATSSSERNAMVGMGESSTKYDALSSRANEEPITLVQA
jgi:hypothetical protein